MATNETNDVKPLSEEDPAAALIADVTSGGPPTPPPSIGADAPSAPEETSDTDFASLNDEFDREEEPPVAPSAPPTAPEAKAPSSAVTKSEGAPSTVPPAQPAEPKAPIPAARTVSATAAPSDIPPGEVASSQPEELDIDIFQQIPVEQPPAAPQAPVVAPPSAPAQTPTGAPAAVPPSPADAFQEARARYMGDLEKAYAIGEEDAKTLMIEPEKVLPKLAARIHVDVLAAVAQGISQTLPQMIRQTAEASTFNQKVNSMFFARWPHLRKKEYIPVIRQTIDQFRAIAPGMPVEQLVQEAGVLASVRLKAVPSRPAAPTGNLPPARPAVGGAGPAPSRVQENEFEKMAREWDREDAMDG